MVKIQIRELPSIMHEVFRRDDCNNYKLRKNRGFKPVNPKTVYYETETIFLLGSKLWIILPDEYKNLRSLKECKTKIKN